MDSNWYTHSHVPLFQTNITFFIINPFRQLVIILTYCLQVNLIKSRNIWNTWRVNWRVQVTVGVDICINISCIYDMQNHQLLKHVPILMRYQNRKVSEIHALVTMVPQSQLHANTNMIALLKEYNTFIYSPYQLEEDY